MALTNIAEQDRAAILAEIRDDPAHVGYADKKPEEVAKLLCQQPQEASAKAPAVLKPLDWPAIMESLAPSIPTLETVALIHVEGLLKSGDRAAAAYWIQVGLAKGQIKAEVAAAVNALLTATQPDPTWPATVPGKSRLEIVTEGRNRGAISPDEVTKILGGV